MSPAQSRNRRTTVGRASKAATAPVEAPAGPPPAPPRTKPPVPKATSDLVGTLTGLAESELALYHRDRALQEALQAADRLRLQIADIQGRLAACREPQPGLPLGLPDEPEDLNGRVRALDEDEQAARRALEHAEQEARTLNAELHEANQAAEQRRRAVLPRLEPEVHRMVDLALRTGRQPVVTTLVGAFCSGCHLRLSATAERQLRAGRKVGSCPHCRRLLYDPDWLQ